MADFNIRSESVDVEQIMKQIRTRIREKRGVDYTEEQIRELASVRLEKFLDPKNLRSDLLEQFRKSRPALPELPKEPPPVEPPYVLRRPDAVRVASRAAADDPELLQPDPEAVLQSQHAQPDPAHAGAVQCRHVETRRAAQSGVSNLRALARASGTSSITRSSITWCSKPRGRPSR